MTVTVNVHNEDQEKVLLEFLNQMDFDYQNEADDFFLTEDQKHEIIKRDSDFVSGKTTARNWNDGKILISKELLHLIKDP